MWDEPLVTQSNTWRLFSESTMCKNAIYCKSISHNAKQATGFRTWLPSKVGDAPLQTDTHVAISEKQIQKSIFPDIDI